ncbi:MAG: hypothetical protein KIT10_15620 [Flavobacteriales bacterium]|nr:hypothetical protein [Flavobacteriales bacterium]
MSAFITIVSGLPRSGTSLLMQMLAAGGMPLLTDGRRAPDIDNPKGYFEFERVKALPADTAWLAEARGRAVKVIHALLRHLPDHEVYRVLLVERALHEVVMSQGRMLARLGRPGGGLGAERMMSVFRQELVRVQSALADKPNVRVLRLQHARLIGDPLAAAQAMNAFLGGGLDTGRMAEVVDPALHRSRTVDPGSA